MWRSPSFIPGHLCSVGIAPPGLPSSPSSGPAQAHSHSDGAWCGGGRPGVASEDACSGSGSASGSSTLAKWPITGAYTSLKYSSAVWWLGPSSSKILGAFDLDCSLIYQYPSEYLSEAKGYTPEGSSHGIITSGYQKHPEPSSLLKCSSGFESEFRVVHSPLFQVGVITTKGALDMKDHRCESKSSKRPNSKASCSR